MSRKILFLIALIPTLLFLSCEKEDVAIDEGIIGKWYIVEEGVLGYYIFEKSGQGSLNAYGLSFTFTYTVKNSAIHVKPTGLTEILIETFGGETIVWQIVSVTKSKLVLRDEYETWLLYRSKEDAYNNPND